MGWVVIFNILMAVGALVAYAVFPEKQELVWYIIVACFVGLLSVWVTETEPES